MIQSVLATELRPGDVLADATRLRVSCILPANRPELVQVIAEGGDVRYFPREAALFVEREDRLDRVPGQCPLCGAPVADDLDLEAHASEACDL